jgi:hypothetical protein
MSYEDQRRKSSLDRGTSSNPTPSGPKAAPAAPAKPVNTSSFLTRIANTAVREAGGGPSPAAQRPNWMAVDHSSPAANLNSRLRWVENAFKAEGSPQQAQQQQPQQQLQAPKAPITGAADFKSAVTVMRKRMQAMHLELAELDKELAEIEQKMSQNQ